MIIKDDPAAYERWRRETLEKDIESTVRAVQAVKPKRAQHLELRRRVAGLVRRMFPPRATP